jgi:uncharacterized protein (DUF427 family)
MSDHAETKTRTVKVPRPDHPITIERNAHRVVVKVAGRVIADTREALTLREASYPAVQYVPRKDVDMTLLERTDHVTYCPYKGDCAYYGIPLGGARSNNAVWTYEEPYAAVAAIKDHVAFYPDRVDAIDRSRSCGSARAPAS